METFNDGGGVTDTGFVDGVTDVYEDIPLDDYEEPQIVRGAEPHTLKIIETPVLRDVETKTGHKKLIDVLFRIQDAENVKLVKYSIWLPGASDTKEQQNIAKGRLLRFQKAVAMTPEATTTGELINRLSECVGAEVQAILGVELSEQYGDKNTVKRLLV